MKELECPNCKAHISESDIDFENYRAKCSYCDTIIQLEKPNITSHTTIIHGDPQYIIKKLYKLQVDPETGEKKLVETDRLDNDKLDLHFGINTNSEHNKVLKTVIKIAVFMIAISIIVNAIIFIYTAFNIGKGINNMITSTTTTTTISSTSSTQ